MSSPTDDTLRLQLGAAGRVIETRGLSRRFGALVAVDGLDLEVRRGEVFGFIGPNGAGKSTAIRMLMGLLAPSAGEVRVLGLEMPRQAEQLRSRVGYMTQRFSLYDDLSVTENLDFAAEIFGLDRPARRRRVAEVIEQYGLGERREQRPATLSGGWKQRLALAAAVIHRPELIFLDEPTAGVDPDNRRLFWDKLFDLADAGVTLLVSTHYMDEAERCHRLCVLRRGRRVAVGRPVSLVEALGGRVVELWARPMGELLRALRRQPLVASVTQIGSRAHVLLAPDAGSPSGALSRLAAALHGGAFSGLGGELAEPNLEDALIALGRGEALLGEQGATAIEGAS